MKKCAMLAAAMLVTAPLAASAADLPLESHKSTPVVARVYSWSGLYAGVNGGYGWGTQDPITLQSNRFDRTSIGINGGMLGGTIGAQIQQGYVVLGLEGDLDWASIKGNGILIPSIAGLGQGITLNTATSVTALGTARARVGVALDNVLFYVTGGAAMARATANGTSIAGVPCGTLGVFTNCAASAWRPGVVAGLGVEYGFTPNWSVKGEYLYTKVIGTTVSTDAISAVRGGLNYRF
jgi:outer membrane immunogenic protein